MFWKTEKQFMYDPKINPACLQDCKVTTYKNKAHMFSACCRR